MARVFKIGDIPTSRMLPSGFYNLRIASFEETYSEGANLLMYKLELRVIAPEICENRAHYENLVIGKRPKPVPDGANEEWAEYCALDDPMGEERLTQRYSSGLRTLKQILIALDHEFAAADTVNMEALFDDFNIKNPRDQLVFGARVVEGVSKKTGREQNNLTLIYPEGKEKPRLLTNEDATGKADKKGKKATAAEARKPRKPRTRAAAPPDDDDDDYDDED